MKWVPLIMFALISIVSLISGAIEAKDIYLGAVIFLAAEYIECAIERKK